MPVDYSLHPIGNPIQGNHPPAPPLPAIAGQKGLAEATDSATITVIAPSVLSIVATAKLRLDLQAAATALDPANSTVVLVADQPRLFSLAAGIYKLKTAVYA